MERADDVNHHCSGMYLINLTNDHNLIKYYGPEFLKERVIPVHIFFGGGGQGEVEIRTTRSFRLQWRAADGQYVSTLYDSRYRGLCLLMSLPGS